MRHYCLTLRFDGTAYHGWQVQRNAQAVQPLIQDALAKILGTRPDVTGCGRTDTGVHALNYTCLFSARTAMDPHRFLPALNINLPDDIAVIGCREVDGDFHPRYDAQSKTYLYKILNTPQRDPFWHRRALHHPYKLDEERMDTAAKKYMGTHDFGGFCGIKNTIPNTTRTVYGAEVFREKDMVYFRVCANGFLYNMVRIMMGTLLHIAWGKLPLEVIPAIYLSRDRKMAGPTAVPWGLYLEKVTYPDL
jgi:tRNA pseudouridine38-40 synthase